MLFRSKDGTTSREPQTTVNTQISNAPSVWNETTVVYGDITLYGKGYGHGVGMSQNGAIAMANNGFRYDEIIMNYYPGVVVR